MLKVLVLAALTTTAVPQAPTSQSIFGRSTPQDPAGIVREKQRALEEAMERKAQFDERAKRRQGLREEKLMVEAELRGAQRELDGITAEVTHRVNRLAAEFEAARLALSQTEVPSRNLAPSHSLRAKYEKLKKETQVLEAELEEARPRKRDLITAAETRVAELEMRREQVIEALNHVDEQVEISWAIRRAEDDLRRAVDASARVREVKAPVTKAGPIVDDFRRARIAAAVAGKPLLVNFTAHTCVNCRAMEVKVFAMDGVADLLDGFVEARLHSDTADDSLRADILERVESLAGTMAQPAYVALDPRSGERLGVFTGADLEGAQFTAFLKTSRAALAAPLPEASNAALWGQVFDLQDEVQRLRADVRKSARKQ